MYKKYFKIAYRILLRKKGYSVINIGGLAIGMITAMLIGLWVQDELSFDNYHVNSDRNAQVMQHRKINGHVETHPIIPIPLEEELRSRYGSDFKYLVTSFWEQEQVLSYKDKKVTKNGNYMGKDAIQLFSLNMLKGTNDGLVEPSSILLSESTANVIFGDIDPMGKLMKINNEMNVAVTGIYEDLPKNSSLHGLAFMSSWELFVSSQDWIKNAREQNNWDMGSFQLFVQLADQVDMQEVSNKIKMVTHEHIGEFEKAYNPQLFLHPMADWHLKSNWKNGMQTGGLIQFVWLFSIIGILVLVLACINFMNLSTAQSEKRSKEVGIRKSLGSMRSQLISQFMTESFLVVLLAFVVTISMVYLVIPYFNELADKNIILPINRFAFWGIAIGFIIITGLLAGSYPALYLSSFRPVEVLKGTFKTGKSAVTFRRGLVILQFTISIALVIGAIVVEKQIQFTKDRPMGYDTNGAIMIWSNSPDFKGKYDLLSTVLKNKQAITEMSESSSPLTGIFSVDGDISWEGKDPNAQVNFASIRVTHEYGKTVDWEIIDGRDFSKEYGADSTALILNATAAEYMNLKNPIGEVIESGNGASAVKFIVVGLINDMLMESPFQAIQPTIYTVGNSSRTKMDCMTMKLNPNKSTEESLALIKEVFSEYIPAMPFDYRFVDEAHGRKFAAVERIGVLSSIFAVLAIFISCLGLFGLASFVTEQRTKEIAIRKIVGASILNIWTMVSRDFVVLVFISCFIAIPIAYYTLSNWLQNFEYRTDFSWWIFVAAGSGAIVITLVTVSFHAIKSATVTPVNSLRSE